MALLVLASNEIDALGKAALDACTIDDVHVVVDARYPGDLKFDDVNFQGATPAALLKACLEKAQLEKGGLEASLVLRLLEQRWAVEGCRRKTVSALPKLLKPERGFDVQVNGLKVAWKALLERLEQNPQVNKVGDVKLFKSLCQGRKALIGLTQTLTRLEALKGAHDRAHTLQVIGAAALDPLGPPGTTAAALAGLASTLEAVKTAMNAAPADIVGAEMAQSMFSWGQCCAAALEHIRSNDDARAAFVRPILRAMLRQALETLDREMFAASRDFDLRRFAAAFRGDAAGLDDPVLLSAWGLAIDFADRLRLRLMEHNLWQTVDNRLHALEQALAEPGPGLIELMSSMLFWLAPDLKALLADDVYEDVVPRMRDALIDHSNKTPEGATAADLQNSPTVLAMRAALQALCLRARSAYYDVDFVLKRDIAQLVTLKAPLQEILDRVPRHCEVLTIDG